MSDLSKFDQFLNRLSFRDLATELPNLESNFASNENDTAITDSRTRVSNLRTLGMEAIANNINDYLSSSLLDDEITPSEFSLNTDEADIIDNYEDNSSIFSMDGDDDIYSVADYNLIDSGRGNDSIVSYGENNEINSNSGDDYIASNGRNNFIESGIGDDLIYIDSNSANSRIDAGSGDDLIDLEEQEFGSISIKGGTGNDTLQIYANESDYTRTTDQDSGDITYTHRRSERSIRVSQDIENLTFLGND